METFAPKTLTVKPLPATGQLQIPHLRSRSRLSTLHAAKVVGFKPSATRWSEGKRKREVLATCSTKCPSDGPEVFVVSDLHTDYAENMAWVKELSEERFRGDVLLVAGDVAETYEDFVSTMSALRERFGRVFFVPGNHDLWCRKEEGTYSDSLEKLDALLDACGEIGVETRPAIVDGGLGIIPLYSWYHESFDKEKDLVNRHVPPLEMVCKDFRACRWPLRFSSKDCSLAHFFDLMNEKNESKIEEIRKQNCQIITFSHYVPRQELSPEKRMLYYPNLPKIIGSDFLESRLRTIHRADGNKTACHVFGHTHFFWDAVLDGIRYVQAPLAYPRERKKRKNGGERWLPFCIYSGGRLTKKLSSYKLV